MPAADASESFACRHRQWLRAIWLLAFSYGVAYLVAAAAMLTAEDNALLEKWWARLGKPEGIHRVFGYTSEYGVIGVTGFVLFGCVAIIGITRIALRSMPNIDHVVRTSALVVALMASGLCFSVTYYDWFGVSETSRASSIASQLQTIRSQLELYQVQHNGDYPKLENMWDSLTKETEVSGDLNTDGSGDELGPYLQQAPNHSWTQDATIAADNSGSWQYIEDTGEIRAVMTPGLIHDLQLSSTDVVRSIHPWPNDPYLSESPWQAFADSITTEWDYYRQTLLPSAYAFLTTYLIALRLLRRLFHKVNLFSRTFSFMNIIGFVAIAGLIGAPFFDDHHASQTLRFTFGFALLWSLAGRVHLLFHPHFQRVWRDGSACGNCGYDLTGTRAAERDACPECGSKFAQLT